MGKPPKLTSERARQIRPPAPAKIHGLHMAPEATAQADVEAQLRQSFPHLKARDAFLVKSLAGLIVLCEAGWGYFFRRQTRLAHRTGSGRIRWNAGLDKLQSLEKQKLDVARELLVTPRARADATPEEPDDELTRLRRKAKTEYPAGTL